MEWEGTLKFTDDRGDGASIRTSTSFYKKYVSAFTLLSANKIRQSCCTIGELLLEAGGKESLITSLPNVAHYLQLTIGHTTRLRS